MESDDLKDKLQAAREQIEVAKMLFEQNMEGVHLISKMLKVRYDSLLKEGFDAQQAMAILCSRGLS